MNSTFVKAIGFSGLVAGLSYTSYYLYNKKTGQHMLRCGVFNREHRPYKLSRPNKYTKGLDPEKKQAILALNEFCYKMSKIKFDVQHDTNWLLQQVFGDKEYTEYEKRLIEKVQWSIDKETNKFMIDSLATFSKFFDQNEHEVWTSAIINDTESIAKTILSFEPAVMGLIETSYGNNNKRGELIPHTNDLPEILHHLNKVTDNGYSLALYAEFKNPEAEKWPQLNRGNAIIVNNNFVDVVGKFIINIVSMKRNNVTTRCYPVCLLKNKNDNSLFLFCTAHVTGYSFKDEEETGKPDTIKIGDNELESVLKVLNLEFSTKESDDKTVKVMINDVEYAVSDESLPIVLKNMGFTKDIPVAMFGDFNQNFNEKTIKYNHNARFPTFVEHNGETVSGRHSFENGYKLAKKIFPTSSNGKTIDGFLTNKHITTANLLSSGYDGSNATSDHCPVVADLFY